MRGLAGSRKAAGHESTPWSHVGRQARSSPGLVCPLKTGFQPCPCSPYEWPWQVTLPPPWPSVSTPKKRTSRGLTPCCPFSDPRWLNQVSAGFPGPDASAGPQSFLLSVTVWFWFPHSGQIETRLCGENVRQRALVTLVSSSPGTCCAWLGLGQGPLVCSLQLPQGRQPRLVRQARQVNKLLYLRCMPDVWAWRMGWKTMSY